MLKAQSFNALDGLKGKVAGVNIFSNTGQPGGDHVSSFVVFLLSMLGFTAVRSRWSGDVKL